jgi:hypothetical protein
MISIQMTIRVVPVLWGQNILDAVSVPRSCVPVQASAPYELIQDTKLDKKHDWVVENLEHIGVLEQRSGQAHHKPQLLTRKNSKKSPSATSYRCMPYPKSSALNPTATYTT